MGRWLRQGHGLERALRGRSRSSTDRAFGVELRRGGRSLDELSVVVDRAGQDPEAHDGTARLVEQIDDLGRCGSVSVTGNHDGAWLDESPVTCLVKERSDVAGLILVVEITADVNGDHGSFHLLDRR